MSDFPTHVFQVVRSLPFHTPEAWKKYSIRTKPFRIVPPPPVQLIPYQIADISKQLVFLHFHFSNSEDCKDCGDYVRHVFSFVPGILAAICVLTVLLLQVSQTVKNQNGECQVCLPALGYVNVLASPWSVKSVLTVVKDILLIRKCA